MNVTTMEYVLDLTSVIVLTSSKERHVTPASQVTGVNYVVLVHNVSMDSVT